MAYLMSDVAAGSNAALQLQQNMAAAPDVQQAQNVAMQQQQANLERTKLANLVADTGIKADQESKQKLMALTQTPEFKAADDVKKLQMISSTQFELGKVEEGAKTLTASELYAAKDIANKQKELDFNAQQIGNAYGIIAAVPDDKVQEFVDRLPPENKKALVSQIGEENWNKMSGPEKKEAAKNLMLNAKGQMAKQLKEVELEKTRMLTDSRERVEAIRQNGLLNRKMMGGSDDEMKQWNTYNIRQQAIENSGKKTFEKLNESVYAAEAKLDKTRFFSGAETTALEKAIKNRDEFQRGQIQKELNLAVSAPDFPGKETIIDNLKQQLELYPTPAKATESKEDKPAAKPTTTTESPKTEATTTEQQALAWAKANPNDPRSKAIMEKLQASNAGATQESDKSKVDNTRYTRTKNTRGMWVYTPSGRGMTKAQYEELDKKKKE